MPRKRRCKVDGTQGWACLLEDPSWRGGRMPIELQTSVPCQYWRLSLDLHTALHCASLQQRYRMASPKRSRVDKLQVL